MSFTFDGINCETLNLYVEKFPDRPVPRRKTTTYSVPGRSGDLIVDEDAWENVIQPYEVYVKGDTVDMQTRVSAIAAWLVGSAGYKVLTDKWLRAMAGLSMGSFQTSITTLTHPDLFGYAGLFSGFMRAPWPTDEAQDHLALAGQPEAFNEAFRVFYRAMGTEDQFFDAFAADDAWLEGKNLNIIRETFPGGHDWTVWRRCIRSFLPRLFQ